LKTLDKNISGIYNLGNGNGFTVLEMLKAARKITGHQIPMLVVQRRSGDPAAVVASSQKARKVLGWETEYKSIDQIIATAWNWYKEL
jgi:UDP-glucose 4-epimerase